MLIPIVLLVLLLFLPACSEDPPPAVPLPAAPSTGTQIPEPEVEPPAPVPVISEKWYAEFQDGVQTGWLHVVWTESEFEGQPSIHDHTESYSVSTRGGGGNSDRFEVAAKVDVERSASGDLFSLRVEEHRGERMLVTEQKFTGDGYVLTQQVAGLTETHRVNCEVPLPTDTEAYLSGRIRAGEVRAGMKLTFPVANFETGKLDRVVLDIEALETLALPTGPCLCYRVREGVHGRPGESILWLDGEGVFRQARTGNHLITSTTRERAQDVSEGGHHFSIVVHAEPVVPRITSAVRSVVTVTLEESEYLEDPDIPETPFSRVMERDGRVYTMELLAHDDPEATIELPVVNADLGKWLESTNLLCADTPEVQAAAKEAVGDVTDGREAAKRILHYVFTRLRKGSGPIPAPTAKEILAYGGGDCSEHAVLFVALCRAVGIPARLLSGYAQVGDKWGSHSFTEIWLGKWIGADPTTNELGTRARYIAFGWVDRDDSYPGLVSSQAAGRMRIVTNEIEECGEVLDLRKPQQASAGRNHLSGLTFAEAPEGWSCELLGGSTYGLIVGPGVHANAQVAHGWGDLPADILISYLMPDGVEVTFAEIPSAISINVSEEQTYMQVMVPYCRRTLILTIEADPDTDLDSALKQIAKIVEPTLR